jgi:capsid protein
MEYMDSEDEFIPVDWQRPALNFVESIDQLLRKAMTAMGLSQTYSLLRVTSSYTAFRGEMLLAWAQFYTDQKFLERHACDWTALKALRWKYGTSLPADLSMSWDWPRMPAVDPLHEAQAVELLIKTLQSNYSEQLGPEWRTKMAQLSEETKTAKELGLPTVWEAEKQGLRFDKVSPRSDNGNDNAQQRNGKDSEQE